MTRYRRLLLGAILGRISTLILLVVGLLLMPKDQNSLLVGFVVVLFGVIGSGQIYHIINYLSLDEEELIEQVEWERKQ